MQKFFLSAKHWQIFVLFFGVTLLLQIAGMIFIGTRGLFLGAQFDPTIFIVFGVVGMIPLLVMNLWLYSVGSMLHRLLPQDIHMRINLFTLCIIFPLLYIPLFMFFVSYMFVQMSSSGILPLFIIALTPLIFLFHFFAMFCMVYVFYFVAKALKSLEMQKQALLAHYIGEIFLLGFFPIGIWFVQPRINKIYTENNLKSNGGAL